MYKLLGFVAVLAISVSAAVIDSGPCGPGGHYVIENNTLTVTGRGEMASYDRDSLPLWYNYRNLVENVVIGEGMTTVGGYSFYNFVNLTNVTIPSTCRIIDHQAFVNCRKLKSLNIPPSVKAIGYLAFEGCTNFTSFDIPEGVTSIAFNAFSGCYNLQTVNIAANLSFIDNGVFSGCTNLTTFTVDPNNANFTTIDGVLYNKNSSTIQVYPCGKGDTYAIPGGVTTIGLGAFYGCPLIKNVIIPEGVISIEKSAFSACTGLTSVTLPSTLESIGSNAFSACKGISSIHIPDKVVSMGSGAFMNCISLLSVDLPPNLNSIEKSVFSGCTNITVIDLPQSVTSVGDSAFSGCKNLTTINMDRLTYIGKEAFSGCRGLKSLTIPSGLTRIEEKAFYSIGITTLTIPSNVQSVGKAAFSYSTVQTVTVEEGVKVLEGSVFNECASLKNVTISSTVESIGYIAFGDCRQLNSIKVNKNNKNYTSVDDVLFSANKTVFVRYPCKKGYYYTIPDGVTFIQEGAFKGCQHQIREVNLPSTVTRIGYYAFEDCWGIEHMTIPASVTELEYGVFFNDGYLRSVTYLGTNNPEGSEKDIFSYCTTLGTVCVPVNYQNYSFCKKAVYALNATFDDYRNSDNQCNVTLVCGSSLSNMQNYSICVSSSSVIRTCVDGQCIEEAAPAPSIPDDPDSSSKVTSTHTSGSTTTGSKVSSSTHTSESTTTGSKVSSSIHTSESTTTGSKVSSVNEDVNVHLSGASYVRETVTMMIIALIISFVTF